MRLITKNFRLQFNSDGTKLIDTKSIGGDKWLDTQTNKLFLDTKKIGSVAEEINSKSILSNFLKMIESILQEINTVIDINKKWLNIKESWKIPIDDGYIVKEPIPESEIQSVNNLIEKQSIILNQYQECYNNFKKLIK